MGKVSAKEPQDFRCLSFYLSYMTVPLQVVLHNYAKVFVAGDVL